MTKEQFIEKMYDDFFNKFGTCNEQCYALHYHGADCIHTAFYPYEEVEYQWEDCRAHVESFNQAMNPGQQSEHVLAYETEHCICF